MGISLRVEYLNEIEAKIRDIIEGFNVAEVEGRLRSRCCHKGNQEHIDINELLLFLNVSHWINSRCEMTYRVSRSISYIWKDILKVIIPFQHQEHRRGKRHTKRNSQ